MCFAGHTCHFVGFVMRWLILIHSCVKLYSQRKANLKIFNMAPGLIVQHMEITYLIAKAERTAEVFQRVEIRISSYKCFLKDSVYQKRCRSWQCLAQTCKIELYGPRQANLVLIAYASSEGSGEPAHPRSLARTFAARSYKQWVKRNLQTESQIRGPSEWLGMRS